MSPPVDTKNAAAVLSLVRKTFQQLYPGVPGVLFDHVFKDVENLFAGQHPDYRANDLHYHNLEHTLQAVVCLTLLLEGAHHVGTHERLSPRQFELAIATALLHDSGYATLRSDDKGTGAKYTLTHVLRSCTFAAAYLPTLGVNEQEIVGVLGAINCTGPDNKISRLSFNNSAERFVGCALATADLLGQMSAADYPDKLEALYREFLESDNFVDMPKAKRMFQSSQELIMRTPDFWNKLVKPRLETDFQAVYRFLARPYPDGPNAYVEGVEQNIAIVRQRIAAIPRTPG